MHLNSAGTPSALLGAFHHFQDHGGPAAGLEIGQRQAPLKPRLDAFDAKELFSVCHTRPKVIP
jgi:hypothetical protein